MTHPWLLFFQYMISVEESRTGRTDYWNGVYLAEKSPAEKICLGFFKVMVSMALSITLVTFLSRL
jgi:hypothetical protein